MKIAIDKNILSNALDIVSKAIANKTTLQILEGVLLEAKDRTLQLTGNNLEIAIQHTVECEVLEPGAVVAEFKLFQDIVRKLPDEEIDITANDKSMTIEAGQVKMEIVTMPAVNYPAIKEIDGDMSLEIDEKDFRDMVNGVSFAAIPDDPTSPAKTAVYLELKDEMLEVAALDGFMLAVRKAECSGGDFKLLLKAVDIDKACKIFGQGKVKIKMSEKANIALLEDDSTKASVRVVEGSFFNYKRFMDNDAETTVRIKSRELKSTIERALLFSDTGDYRTRVPIEVIVKCDSLRIFADNAMGRIDETIPVDTTGEDLDIRLNPKQIYEFLKRIEDDEVLLKFSGNMRPCIIVPVDGDRFFYMAVPVTPKKGV